MWTNEDPYQGYLLFCHRGNWDCLSKKKKRDLTQPTKTAEAGTQARGHRETEPKKSLSLLLWLCPKGRSPSRALSQDEDFEIMPPVYHPERYQRDKPYLEAWLQVEMIFYRSYYSWNIIQGKTINTITTPPQHCFYVITAFYMQEGVSIS